MTNEEAIAALKEKYCGVGSNDLFVFRKAIEALENADKETRTASIFDLVRMCKHFVDTCEGCPLEKHAGPCPPFDFSEEDNKAVLKWCYEHPQKDLCGNPLPCRKILFGPPNGDCSTRDCSDCWNEYMPEVTK
mgnify:CR=1 FL=1